GIEHAHTDIGQPLEGGLEQVEILLDRVAECRQCAVGRRQLGEVVALRLACPCRSWARRQCRNTWTPSRSARHLTAWPRPSPALRAPRPCPAPRRVPAPWPRL